MQIITIKKGRGLTINNLLAVTVLEIMREKVRLGFTPRQNGSSDSLDNDLLSEIHGVGWSYNQFSCSGVRMLVLESPKFEWVDILQSKQLVIVEVKWAEVTMALCNSHERDCFEANGFCRPANVPSFSTHDA